MDSNATTKRRFVTFLLFLDKFQSYIQASPIILKEVLFLSRISLSFSTPMRWNEPHDVFLCREVLFIKPYQFKPGSKESGNAWNLVSENANSNKDLTFMTSQKSVRDRFKLLCDKHKRKMREEESSSGLHFEESELDNLLQNIIDEMKNFLETHENQTKEKLAEKKDELEKAEEVRQKALETFSETKKRKSTSPENSKKFKRNSGSETLEFLRTRGEQEYSAKKEEIELRRAQIEIQKQQQTIMQQQQQMMQQQMFQQTQVLTSLLEKIVNK